MGFREERHRLVSALRAAAAGDLFIVHDPRRPDDNWLADARLTLSDVEEIAIRGQGGHYASIGPHHDVDKRALGVHELANVPFKGRLWYVKWYFSGQKLCFISVHPKRERAS